MPEIVVAERFCGPSESGNGGYTCGLVAAFIDGPAQVTLRKPPPLDRPLTIQVNPDATVSLLDRDVGRALGKRVVAQCVNEVERFVHSVDKEPAAHCPSRRWLACEEPQELGDRIARPRPAARKWTGQRAGKALEERTVEVIRAAVGNAGGEAMLGTRCARREMRPETQTDQRNTRGVDVGARERVVEYRGMTFSQSARMTRPRSIRAAPWPGPSNANTL